MNELVPVFKDSILDCPIDIGSDLLEVGIDSVLKDGVLRDVPIVGTVIRFGKTVASIYDRNLIRQTLGFINGFNAHTINDNRLSKYRKRMEDPKIAEKELGRVLILLNRNIDIIKSQFDGRFYSAYVNGEITWDNFCELADITDRLFVSDLNALKEAYDKNGIQINANVSYRHDRLISNGLLTNEARLNGSIIMQDLDSDEQDNLMDLTEIGNIFCKYAFDEADVTP